MQPRSGEVWIPGEAASSRRSGLRSRWIVNQHHLPTLGQGHDGAFGTETEMTLVRETYPLFFSQRRATQDAQNPIARLTMIDESHLVRRAVDRRPDPKPPRSQSARNPTGVLSASCRSLEDFDPDLGPRGCHPLLELGSISEAKMR